MIALMDMKLYTSSHCYISNASNFSVHKKYCSIIHPIIAFSNEILFINSELISYWIMQWTHI